MLTDQQDWIVVEMVRARNDIQLPEIKQAIEANNDTFASVASISLPTIARRLKRHLLSMKHVYLVPFERNNMPLHSMILDQHRKNNNSKYIYLECDGA